MQPVTEIVIQQPKLQKIKYPNLNVVYKIRQKQINMAFLQSQTVQIFSIYKILVE